MIAIIPNYDDNDNDNDNSTITKVVTTYNEQAL